MVARRNVRALHGLIRQDRLVTRSPFCDIYAAGPIVPHSRAIDGDKRTEVQHKRRTRRV